MEWTDERDVLFCREVLVFDLFMHKPGSRERGLCLDRIAENLNSIETVWFKVNQRSLRDRLIKLLKIFKSKRSQEEKASGIAPDHTELDDFLQDILERQQQAEIIATEKSDEQLKKTDKERVAAEKMRKSSMERLSEKKKDNRRKVMTCAISQHQNKEVQVATLYHI